MTASLFEQFRKNISVQNASDISSSYEDITIRLNKDFWESESRQLHTRQIGSYGRHTAIHGVSDLDMIFELPWSDYERYKKMQGNGPSQLLQNVRKSLKVRYPKTEIKGDGQVVVVEFFKYRVEVLPVFYEKDEDAYRFGDSNNGGSWKICKPVQEISAVNERNKETNRNYKHVCKMIRAWKNSHGVNIGGLLIDTLVYNFFSQNSNYHNKSYASYGNLFVSLFSYLGSLGHQDYWAAPGSGQRVYSSGKFQPKAKKAAANCQLAIDADTEKKKAKLWREVFGRSFPSETVVATIKAEAMSFDSTRYTTEQFIEDLYPVDIQYDLEIDSDVSENGTLAGKLRTMSKIFNWLPKGRSLTFYVEECTVPSPYQLMWKIRNVGLEAERRKMIRGQIFADQGRNQQREATDFHGEHFVEAYVIKDGVCVARDIIDVRINQ